MCPTRIIPPPRRLPGTAGFLPERRRRLQRRRRASFARGRLPPAPPPSNSSMSASAPTSSARSCRATSTPRSSSRLVRCDPDRPARPGQDDARRPHRHQAGPTRLHRGKARYTSVDAGRDSSHAGAMPPGGTAWPRLSRPIRWRRTTPRRCGRWRRACAAGSAPPTYARSTRCCGRVRRAGSRAGAPTTPARPAPSGSCSPPPRPIRSYAR